MIHNSESIPCIIGSTLGMFGALGFGVVYISFKAIRNFPRKLVFVLAIYDFISSLVFILPGPIASGLCKAQVYLIAYTFPTPSYWCFIIAIIFILKIYGWKYMELERFFIGAHIIMHVIEIIITSLFIAYGTPRIAFTHWCWVKEIWLEAIIYSFYWAFLIGCLVFYSILIWKAKKIKGQSDFEKGFQIKMFFIPILYIFTAFWTSWKRLREMIDPSVSTKKWFKCCSKKKTDDKEEKDTENDLESTDISSDEKKAKKKSQYYPTLPNQGMEVEMNPIDKESSSTEDLISHSGVDVKSIEQDDL
ncbi:g protein-coupled receptor [Anaeramoeba ignava]|uniref:G protein-coupled receptor n=1 Tax=Anaeramoeba ignava TaxID=1746090 RepID=A0A9Q0LDN4_ANAIG|nr:g protein-coupled receptor [Anaeramoeba ignava]